MRGLRNGLCAAGMLIAGAGCATPSMRWQSPTGVTPMDAGTPSGNVAAREVREVREEREGREVRYYKDESGALWDDRGRKLEPGEKPVGAKPP